LFKNRSLLNRLMVLVIFLGLGFAFSTSLNLPAAALDDEGGAGESPFDNLAVALVIDISGSMSYTDPLRLRETASGMFIDLLGADDYLSVITFDHEAEVVKQLGPVGSRSDKEALMEELSPRLDHRGNTDFVGALEEARSQFVETDTGGKVPVIFMLTDGEPNPFPGALDDEDFMEGYMEELWELVDELAEDELMVYSVAFSDEKDPDVMEEMASVTGGKTYLLEDPSNLLVTFYEALERLKDRRGFLDQSVDLDETGEHTFKIKVDQAVRQANLVLVGPEGSDDEIEVRVEAPGGEPAGEIEELILGGRDNYKLMILSRPQEEHFGEWAVEVQGSGEVRALGNADLYLEALLMDPDPEAHYPVDEPLEIRVELITREKYEGDDIELEMEVTGPDQERAVSVPMQRDGNSFRGVFEEANRTGEYELAWNLLLDGSALLGDSAVITVRDLPGINTDFWSGEEGFRLGEEIVVSATLESGGTRMQQGAHLQVEQFDFDLEYRDGTRYESELFDRGEQEHGNSRADDGIWSNRVTFERKGVGEAQLTVGGVYQGADFVLRRSFNFSVGEPGEVLLSMLSGEEYIWTRAGNRFEVPLELASSSDFTQVLRFSSDDEQVELLDNRTSLAPGEVKTFRLEAKAADDLEPGAIVSGLEIRLEDQLAEVTPASLEYEVHVLTLVESLQEMYGDFLSGAGVFVLGGLLLAGFIFAGGGLLNRFYLEPRLLINGQLYYIKGFNNPHPSTERERKLLNLKKKRKRELVIAFGFENPGADFVIPESDYTHDMVISNRWNDHLPKFVRGWKALFSRKLLVETFVKCTPPGVLVTGGKVFTQKELDREEDFESGDITFRYQGLPGKGTHQGRVGKNLLEGKS